MPSINRYIMMISRYSNRFRDERLFGTGLRGKHCAYLLYIVRHPGTTQEAIAHELCVNRSSVTRQLALLEQSGFVERRQNETDSRAMEVYLTDKALSVLPKIHETLHEWNALITAGFAPEERDAFSSLLSKAARLAQAVSDRLDADAPSACEPAERGQHPV